MYAINAFYHVNAHRCLTFDAIIKIINHQRFQKSKKKMLRVVVHVCVLILSLTPSSLKKDFTKKLRRSEDELVVSRQEGPLSICGAGREFRTDDVAFARKASFRLAGTPMRNGENH